MTHRRAAHDRAATADMGPMCPTCLQLTQEVDDLRAAAATAPRGRPRSAMMRAKLQLAAHMAVAHSDAPDIEPASEGEAPAPVEAVAAYAGAVASSALAEADDVVDEPAPAAVPTTG